MRDVAGELGAAPGRVDADDDGAGDRRRAEPHGELRDVVEQDADVEGAWAPQLLEQGGALGARGHVLGVAPRAVLEQDRGVLVGGAGADELGDRRHRVYAAVYSTCRERNPRTKAFGMRSGATPGARCTSRSRGSSSSNITRISRRASAAPRQKWVPKPNATCGLGSRPTSKRSGASNTASSRFADGYMNRSSSPAFTGVPATSVSRVAVRRMLRIGVTQRMNSSTATGNSAGSSSSRC